MTTVSAWRVRGDISCGCSCDAVCPCEFGSDPTRGFCETIIGFHIEEGNHGNTRLDGLNFLLYARAPGNFFAGGFTMGAYIDQRATPEQVQVLETIISGQAGGYFGAISGLVANPLPPKQVPINYEVVDGEHRITVPGLLEHGTEPLLSPMSGEPLNIVIHESATGLYSGPWNPKRTTAVKLTDPDLSFDYSGSHACTGRFDYSGP